MEEKTPAIQMMEIEVEYLQLEFRRALLSLIKEIKSAVPKAEELEDESRFDEASLQLLTGHVYNELRGAADQCNLSYSLLCQAEKLLNAVKFSQV
jgi:hypothetical protein